MSLKLPIPLLFGALVFAATGSLLLYLAIDDMLDTSQFLSGASYGVGTVEDIRQHYQEIGSTARRSRTLVNSALIRLTLASGETVLVVHDYGLWEAELQTGQQVRLAYQAQAPEQAKLVNFAALWAGHIGMLVLGSLFVGAAYLLIRVFR